MSLGGKRTRRQTNGSKKERPDRGGSSSSNFFERFSVKQKSDKTKSKRGTGKKRFKRNESEGERSKRKKGRKSECKDEQSNKGDESYEQASNRESHSSGLNNNYGKNLDDITL